MWITEDTIVAANGDTTKFLIFDRKTEKWSEFAAGNFVNWAFSGMASISLLRLVSGQCGRGFGTEAELPAGPSVLPPIKLE